MLRQPHLLQLPHEKFWNIVKDFLHRFPRRVFIVQADPRKLYLVVPRFQWVLTDVENAMYLVLALVLRHLKQALYLSAHSIFAT